MGECGLSRSLRKGSDVSMEAWNLRCLGASSSAAGCRDSFALTPSHDRVSNNERTEEHFSSNRWRVLRRPSGLCETTVVGSRCGFIK